MRRRRSTRVRNEFLHLEAALDPGYCGKAWRQFIGFVLGGDPGEGSPAEQFRLHDRIIRVHARRDCYNVARRWKRLAPVIALARPEYALLLRLGLAGDFGGEGWVRLLRGGLLTDARLGRRFFAEMQAYWKSVFPDVPPWVIRPVAAGRGGVHDGRRDPARREFVGSLLPYAPGGEPGNIRPFARTAEPEPHHAEDTPAETAAAAS